ncbi:MAG: hypothetical protein FD135_155 [Comamonadaceae bacterium]|nr:MAG: hypothetical protein FD135_155 [Comamonadaceae bacterium]
MAFFDWLKRKPAQPQHTVFPPSELTPHAPQAAPVRPTVSPVDEDLKIQRQERREHMYAVVRDVMLRSEVLASRYKFKVLSLDVRGRQFLIMMDLLNTNDLPSEKFMDVERLMAATAAQQHDLQVKAVYWRVSFQAEVIPQPETKAPPTTTPAPRVRRDLPKAQSDFEPIGQDEVLAFQQAVAAGTAAKPVARTAAQPISQPESLTGYEDTQVLEPADNGSPLSATQYGGL